MGIGIDEETAMIVNKTEFEVAGKGAVTVIDGGAMTYTSLPYAESGDGLSLYGVSVHVLAAGAKFDLANRRPVEAEAKRKAARSSEDSGKADAKRPRTRRASK